MMQDPRSRDVCVRVFPSLTSREQDSSPVRSYDVAVYTTAPLNLPPGTPTRTPEEMNGLPRRTSGKLTLKWERYQEILAQFFEAEKGIEAMQFRLRDALSQELLVLVDNVLSSPSGLSIWWNIEAPELDDLPWELLFYAKPNVAPPPDFIFVRGLPPQTPTPVLPLSGDLRVLWTDHASTPQWLRTMMNSGFPGLKTIPSTGDLREALRSSAAEGVELVHLCADGSVTLAYEGLLVGDSGERDLSASELSEVLSGSRVSLIGLTPVSSPRPSDWSGSDRSPEVYRAFACMASARTRLPSMVVPIGPTTDAISLLFWQAFHSAFAGTHRLDQAFANAKNAARASTFALFLRNSPGKLFRDVQEGNDIQSPARMATELQESSAFLDRIEVLGAKYGALPDYVSSFAKTETTRRQNIETELGKWTATEAEK